MPYVTIPKDLSRIKPKVALNMTKRQLICFGIAAATGLPVFFLTRNMLGNSGSVLLMMAVMLPAFIMAMYEKDGQPAEKLIANYLRARVVRRGIRLYQTENFYQYLERCDISDAKSSATDGRFARRPASQTSEAHNAPASPKGGR